MAHENPSRGEDLDLNPYAPPASALSEVPEHLDAAELAEAETIRRKYLVHETSVKSIGTLHYLGVFLAVTTAGAMVFSALARPVGTARAYLTGLMLVGALFYFLMGGLHLALGIGLNRLQTWSRWTEVVLLSIGLLAILLVVGASAVLGDNAMLGGGGVAFAFSAYMLYLLVSPKSSRIFTPEYRAIIAQTPHIKYRMGLLPRIAIALLVMIFGLAFVTAVVSSMASR